MHLNKTIFSTLLAEDCLFEAPISLVMHSNLIRSIAQFNFLTFIQIIVHFDVSVYDIGFD